MKTKTYPLYVPGGHKIRECDNGQFVETRYIEVVPTDIKSLDRHAFLELLAAVQRDDLDYCRAWIC